MVAKVWYTVILLLLFVHILYFMWVIDFVLHVNELFFSSSHLRGRKFSSEANTQKLAEGSDDKKEEVSTPDAEIKKLNESIVDLTVS